MINRRKKEEGSSAMDVVADVTDGLFARAQVEEDRSWKKEDRSWKKEDRSWKKEELIVISHRSSVIGH
jgi:hypothetical protein